MPVEADSRLVLVDAVINYLQVPHMFHKGFIEELSVGRIILIPNYFFHLTPSHFDSRRA